MTTQGTTTGACDCYQLTDNVAASGGAIWSPTTISLNDPFDFSFEVNLGCEDVWGADGMVFVLQESGTGVGGIGNGIGYGTYGGNPNPLSANSIGIEIDTWNSSPAVVTDIASDHIGMNSGGGNEHDVVGPIAIPNIEDCVYHTFQITWDPIGQNLEVILDGNSIFVYNGDVSTNFFGGNTDVFFGWTAGTGGVTNIHSACMYRNAAFTPDITSICENGTVNFTDNSTSDLNMITDWSWDFGDGSPIDNTQNPSHTYTTAGVHTVTLTMTDISGCTDQATVDITVTPGLNINMTQQNVSCFGFNDGTGTATSTNGTAPFVYLWDDLGTQGTQTATGLPPNTYNVLVTDNVGCTGTGSVTITEPVALTIANVTPVDATCGINNGQITITEAGGTGPFQYSIDGGTTFQAGNNFTGLAPNTYNVEVLDANMCSITTTATVNSNSTLVLNSLVVTDEVCGQADGTITANVSLGLAPYQYSIDGGATYQPGNLFSNLVANVYTVQVLDGNNCIVTGNATVNSPSTLVIDLITPTDPSCAGFADGEIDVTASGGTGPYTYSVDNGTSFQGGTNFAGLIAGLYDVIVEDATGCQTPGNTTLTDPLAVNIDNVTPVDVSCFGDTDGQLTIAASGGVPGYTYSIDNGVTFQAGTNFTNLAPANYDVQVNDNNGCPANVIATVGEPTQVQIDNIAVTDVTCNGLADGAITITVSQGTPTYTYSIDGINFQAANVFNALGAGNVTVDVQDANGCPVQGNAVISESQPLVATLGNDTTICIGGSADICATTVGGTAPFDFSFNGISNGVNNCITSPIAANFDLIVTDANGCTSALVSQEVFQFTALSVIAGTDATICAGDAVQLTAEANGGDGGPYVYTWVNQNDFSTLNGAVQNVNPTVNTVYTVGVQDGCETPPVMAGVTITTHPVPQIIITPDVTEGCEPVEVLFSNDTDPTLLVSTNWDFGNGEVQSGNGTISNQVYDEPGCYDVYAQITTVNGCVADTTYQDLICVYELPVADFECNPEDPDQLNPEVVFENLSTGGQYYDWTFGDGNSSTDFTPSNVYPEIGAQTYLVELTVSTDYGCTDQTQKYVTINEVVQFYVPNAITVNSDDFNEYFLPIFLPGFNPLGYSLQIFDRWGVLMYESQDVNTGWDGTYLGVIVPEDVYVWKMEFRENQTDITYRHFGHISVLK
jgi:gliding motility-associated-like protein